MVKMDKSFTLCEPKIECETGALKKRKNKKSDKTLRQETLRKWTWWLSDCLVALQ